MPHWKTKPATKTISEILCVKSFRSFPGPYFPVFSPSSSIDKSINFSGEFIFPFKHLHFTRQWQFSAESFEYTSLASVFDSNLKISIEANSYFEAVYNLVRYSCVTITCYTCYLLHMLVVTHVAVKSVPFYNIAIPRSVTDRTSNLAVFWNLLNKVQKYCFIPDKDFTFFLRHATVLLLQIT